MKKYIKPVSRIFALEAATLMAGSLRDNGLNGGLDAFGSAGASGGRAKRRTLDGLWEEAWDGDDDDEEEEDDSK